MKLHKAFGKEHGVFEWSLDPRCQVPHSTLKQRIKSGWSMERALTQPLRRSIDHATRQQIAKLFAQGFTGREIARQLQLGHSTPYSIRGRQR
jgi:DNA invertase Pin-like site-specific DNA recombinase